MPDPNIELSTVMQLLPECVTTHEYRYVKYDNLEALLESVKVLTRQGYEIEWESDSYEIQAKVRVGLWTLNITIRTDLLPELRDTQTTITEKESVHEMLTREFGLFEQASA